MSGRLSAPGRTGRGLAGVVVVVLAAGPAVLLDATAAGAATIPYTFTGGPETLTVPAGVCGYQVVAFGANGGQVVGVGGIGGGAEATILVAAGDVLQINVGGAGQEGENPDPVGPGGAGGFNGGGPGGDSYRASGSAGGGGASDVRTGMFSLGERVVVAGGGGGGANGGSAGGDGGGTAGAPGGVSVPRGGGGGTQVLGGDGGTSPNGNGVAGGSGVGGDGGDQSLAQNTLAGGGGGGGGYFGGGGGGAQDDPLVANAGGGGGGSGFGTTLTGGSNPGVDGDGSVTLTEIPCFARVGAATGGFPTNYPKSNIGVATAVAATPILVVPRFTG